MAQRERRREGAMETIAEGESVWRRFINGVVHPWKTVRGGSYVGSTRRDCTRRRIGNEADGE